MKVIVLGANGMLGGCVATYFKRKGYDTISTTRCFGFDAREFHKSALADACTKANTKPFLVINCIGAIKQKYSDPKVLFDVNGVFPVQLARFLTKFEHARMLHISTDCVFSGQAPLPVNGYTESSLADARDFYGQSKLIGEQCRFVSNTCVIRTSIIGESFDKSSLLEWVRSQDGSTVNGYTNHIWQGVTCAEVAKFCEYKAIFDTKCLTNLQHLFCSHPVSKYELIRLIAAEYRLNIAIFPSESDTAISRKLSSNIECYRAGPIEDLIQNQREFYSA